MCIVIDANTLTCVFNEENADHHDFNPVYKWILGGKGKMVYGGSQYERELEKVRYLRRLFIELEKVRKIVVLDKDSVDNKAAGFAAFVKHRDFDDPHLIAIVAVGGVKLICTNEKRAIPFLLNPQFYSKGKKPKIYQSADNAPLLEKKYCRHCKTSCRKHNKETIARLNTFAKKSQ